LGKVRILLADDHRPFLEIVESLVASTCEVVGRVSDGQCLFEAAGRLKPDVIVTDISMPILNGIEASRQLTAAGSVAKIIFLTAHADSEFVQTCMGLGALGYVTKARLATDLIPAIQEAVAGHTFISPSF
jgi:DNA-binding NarL/FixJ family response regulator